ncbi:MAG: acetate--CoA ligase family protein [Planktomarina sp.]
MIKEPLTDRVKTERLSRLFNPKTIVVVGGGAWCEAIIAAADQIGFAGDIIPVHPTKSTIAGIPAKPSVADIGADIDATFVGVNRYATLDVIADLRAKNAGGAICFASGFSEAEAEDATGTDLQAQLLKAAADMPILGPNCYGFLNALDGAGIWPDQHGMTPVDRGVAILTQSSNILINLTMQMRGLPIGKVIACGNQAQTTQTDIALHLLDDPRITAIGLHIEGFGDLRGWEVLATKAHAKNIPLIAMKSGKSDQAQAAAVSHTASLTGSEAGADAFLDRLGIRHADSLPVFLEALKLAHTFGPLQSNQIASISCSGGEAALAADTALALDLTFPPLTDLQSSDLRDVLGPMVALANPLDYHTYIWRNEAKMTACWAALTGADIALTLVILDYPRGDLCNAVDWDIATNAVIAAAKSSSRPFAIVATLPELLPEATAKMLMANGIGALNGLDHALAAISLMSRSMIVDRTPLQLPGDKRQADVLTEAAGKAVLSEHGVCVPKGQVFTKFDPITDDFEYPVAAKVLGLAHKTGAHGLVLNLQSVEAVEYVRPTLADGDILVEEMVMDTVVELLVGVTRDPAHGFLLTLGAGGIMTEILSDSQSILIPASRNNLESILNRLKIAPVIHGYRGKPAADIPAILDTIMAVQSYVVANAATLEEVEINPLLCTPTRAVAVDALIRKADD